MKTIKYSIPKQIANHIEEQIKNGTYKIGDKLPTEPVLSDYYGASRNTIREAVQSLIHAGILEARQGKGTYVIACERLQVDMFNFMINIDVENVMEVRKLLEEHIVQAASIRRTDEDLKDIEKHLTTRNNYSEEIKENTKADIDFHISISKASHNPLLIKMYEYVSQFFFEHICVTLKQQPDKQDYINKLHTSLYESMKNKDSNLSKEIIKDIINL